MAHTSIPMLRMQRVYIGSPRPGRATESDPVSTKAKVRVDSTNK